VTENAGGTPDPNSETGGTPADGSTENTGASHADADSLRTALHNERSQRKGIEKQLRDMQSQLTTFQDRDKTDLEKASARAEQAERELTTYRTRDLARTIASDAGIPDLWEALHGDEDQMKSLAKTLADRLGTAGPPPPGELGAGARGSGTVPTGTKAMSDQIRRAAGRRA
jgi:TolA-binding protein